MNTPYMPCISKKNDAALEEWNKQYGDNPPSKSISRKFTMGTLKPTLKKVDSKLLPFVERLYQRAIDFGVHPNRDAIDSNLMIIQSDEPLQSNEPWKIKSTLFHDDPSAVEASMYVTANMGVACLLIFEHIFPELFEKFQIFPNLLKYLGTNVTLEEFKQNLSSQ